MLPAQANPAACAAAQVIHLPRPDGAATMNGTRKFTS